MGGALLLVNVYLRQAGSEERRGSSAEQERGPRTADSLQSRISTGRKGEGEGEGEAYVLRACSDDGAGMPTIPWELFFEA